MTSIRLELDQVAQGFFWPVRALAAAVRALDRGLRHAGMRRAVKVAVDFCCGAAAVVTAVATLLLVVLLTLFLCVGVRALRRWSVAEARQRARPSRRRLAPPHRVLIAAAGQHGLSIGRELMEGAAPDVELVGFLDDDP